MAEQTLSALLPDDYKIILLGDISVGKTTFFLRIKAGEYVDTATLTTSVEYQPFVISFGSGEDRTDVKAILYDTAGDERYRTLTSNYYRDADAAILMYSVEDRFSFEKLQDEIENAMQVIEPEHFVWAVIGNKCDLKREVADESIDALRDQLDTELTFFTSAKTGENVVQAFEQIVQCVHRTRGGKPRRADRSRDESFKVLISSASRPNKCCSRF